MAFTLESLYKSLVRHVTDTITHIRDQGISDDLEYYAWDSRMEVGELPYKDLMGLAGWTFSENRGLWTIHCGLSVSTYNDENLFREIKILDAVHDLWGEGASVPMRDHVSGEIYTSLYVTEFDVMPAAQSEKRNFRPIGLELLRTGTDGQS